MPFALLGRNGYNVEAAYLQKRGPGEIDNYDQ